MNKTNDIAITPRVALPRVAMLLNFETKVAADTARKMDLANLAIQAATEVELPNPEAPFLGRTGKYRPQMLMTLLAYCYANELYASEDIVAAIPSDTALRYITSENRLDSGTLRLFRRRNAKFVQDCLELLLCGQWEKRLAEEGGLPKSDDYLACSLGRFSRRSIRPNFAFEAAARMYRAISADTLISDE